MTPLPTPSPQPSLGPDLIANSPNGLLIGVINITFAGLMDCIIPQVGLWAILGCTLSYFFKLALLLWWALPAGSPICVPTPPGGPEPRSWVPGSFKLMYTINHHLSETLSRLSSFELSYIFQY